jgi:AcrR family transcriptional regulator
MNPRESQLSPQKIAHISEGRAAPRRSRRQSRLDSIVEGAAGLFNEDGIGAVSLADVAERVGIGRATLYHYVADREDLVFQCFQRSCELDTERLAVAGECSNAVDAVLQYFRESVSATAPAAVVTDLGYMSADGRSIIGKALRRNHLTLIELIARGVDRQEIRPCDERVVAHALASMISHVQMAHRWVDLSSSTLDIEALLDSICFGAVIDRDRTFHATIDAERFNRLKAASFEPGSMGEMRIEQILMTASRMFNMRGVEAVSLDEIATELGATRGAVYHYFSDKEDLVRRCADRAHDLYEAFIDEAESVGRDSFERLSIVGHLNSQAQAGTLQPLASWIGLDAFSPGQRQRHRQRLRSLLRRTVGFAEEGIAAGDRRPLDPRTLAVARAGAFSWIPRWEPPIGDLTPFRIADELTAMFNRGIAL